MRKAAVVLSLLGSLTAWILFVVACVVDARNGWQLRWPLLFVMVWPVFVLPAIHLSHFISRRMETDEFYDRRGLPLFMQNYFNRMDPENVGASFQRMVVRYIPLLMMLGFSAGGLLIGYAMLMKVVFGTE